MEAVLIGGKEMKKYKISFALTCFAIIIGIILIILIGVCGKNTLLDILIKGYVFSIPIWIILINYFKKKI